MNGQEPHCKSKALLQLQKFEIHHKKERDMNSEEQVHVIKQFVNEVSDFSSQYGSDSSISYTAFNIMGKPSKFPDYGDFPQAFVMKTYGPWWKEAPSYSPDYVPQPKSSLVTDDFIEITFEQKVYPVLISIYETYNPGAVVRIWAKNDALPKYKWLILWEGQPMNVGQIPRVFSPTLNKSNFKTNVLRLEFNHTRLDYYTAIDAVLLAGTEELVTSQNNSPSKALNASKDENSEASGPVLGQLTQQVIESNLHSIPKNGEEADLQAIVAEFQKKNDNPEVPLSDRHFNGSFKCLPNETILKILGYLDLTSLRRIATVNKFFLSLCNDSFFYVKLSLKPYWSRLHDEDLLNLAKISPYLQQLDLSWCGSSKMITSEGFAEFVKSCCQNLTHIKLNCCKFVNSLVIKALTETCPFLKELGLRNCFCITEAGFISMSHLHNIERLDIYRTNITIGPLVSILEANPNMRHLNLGSCRRILVMDDVANAVGKYNKKMVSLDFCKTSTLTQVGVGALCECKLLEEVDFGWCLGFTLPIDCLIDLAMSCPGLKKLFLTAARGLADKDLEPFVSFCPNLEQIDLLGVRSVSPEICLRFLMDLPKLKMLDLSFCDTITDAQILNWRCAFPNVSIKRSFQNEATCNFLYQHSIQ